MPMSNNQINVAGLKLNAITKQELLQVIDERIKSGSKTFLTTLYSEFLFASLRDREAKALLNKADIAVADGIGVIWANYFLSRNFSISNFYLKIFQAWVQVILTGAQILFNPKKIFGPFPQKIVGADLVWDLAKLAEEKNYSIFLLGWPQQNTARVAEILKTRFPEIRIAGFADSTPDNNDILEQIREAKPDMLFCAFGPFKQERWIAAHIKDSPIMFAVGLGGTFDYMLGKVPLPPAIIRKSGLEWLYRLFTQPTRFRRIINATFGLVVSLVRYKVFESCSLRPNASAVAINENGKILIVQRNPHDPYLKDTDGKVNSNKYENYWQFPRGGIEKGETPAKGAQRELFEEVGIGGDSVEVLKTSERTVSYEWNNALRPLFGNVYHHRGQEQHITYFRYHGPDDSPKPDGRELVAYKWIDIGELSNTLHPEQSDIIEIIKYDLSLENAH